MAFFDFDKARAERHAKADPPTIVVDGETFTLPVGLPAALNLELMSRDTRSTLTLADTIDMLKLLFPPETVDGWLADGWTDVDVDRLFASAMYLMRGVPMDEAGIPQIDQPDGDEAGEPGEAPAPNEGRTSSSQDGQRSKQTSPPTTGSTSRTRTRSRS